MKIKNKTRLPLSHIQYSIWILQAIRQKKEIKGIQIGKEEVKLSLFVNDNILYLIPERLHQKLLRDIIHFQQSSSIKSQYKKLVAFLYTNNKQAEKKTG
jgi:hypothetical protein